MVQEGSINNQGGARGESDWVSWSRRRVLMSKMVQEGRSIELSDAGGEHERVVQEGNINQLGGARGRLIE